MLSWSAEYNTDMKNRLVYIIRRCCVCSLEGGTLKIYGETICPEVPYKTLLLSMNDTVAHVVRETLDKYGLEKEDAHHYCLMQVTHAVLAGSYLPFSA